jgi:hypothetical protein
MSLQGTTSARRAISSVHHSDQPCRVGVARQDSQRLEISRRGDRRHDYVLLTGHGKFGVRHGPASNTARSARSSGLPSPPAESRRALPGRRPASRGPRSRPARSGGPRQLGAGSRPSAGGSRGRAGAWPDPGFLTPSSRFTGPTNSCMQRAPKASGRWRNARSNFRGNDPSSPSRSERGRDRATLASD